MEFRNLRVKDIHGVVLYDTDMPRWTATDRNSHIVGIKLSGAAMHDLGYTNFVMARNDVYFLNRRDDYKVEVYESGASFSIHFTTYEDIETDSFCIPAANPDEIVSVLKKAEITQNEENELMLTSLFYRLCAELERTRRKTYFPIDKRAAAAKAYIDIHFREKRCLSDAVNESGITGRRLGEIFKTAFGITPNKYVVFRRVEYAKNLLETRCLSMSDIAEKCGFSDVYYFSKVFKTVTGLQPSKWTKNSLYNK